MYNQKLLLKSKSYLNFQGDKSLSVETGSHQFSLFIYIKIYNNFMFNDKNKLNKMVDRSSLQ